MKNYNEYTQEELDRITTISNKFHNNEFVNDEDYEFFLTYKKAVKNGGIEHRKLWEESDNGEVPEIIEPLVREAERIYETLRKVPTFDLIKTCEYILLAREWEHKALNVSIAERVLQEDLSEELIQFIRETFEESTGNHIGIVRQLTTPISERHWYYSYNNKTSYCPVETPCDAYLYDMQPHYVYIHSEVEGRWGDTYWISDNCHSTLYSLPVIKDFKNFDFEIGHFYKITCVDEIYFARGKKKYCMEIEEITEETFMSEGFKAFARG